MKNNVSFASDSVLARQTI